MTRLAVYLVVAVIAANVLYHERPRPPHANHGESMYATVSVIAALIWPATVLGLGLSYLPALILYPAREMERRNRQAFSKEGE